MSLELHSNVNMTSQHSTQPDTSNQDWQSAMQLSKDQLKALAEAFDPNFVSIDAVDSPPTSALYFDDDDDEFMRAINEDPAFAAVSQIPLTTPDNSAFMGESAPHSKGDDFDMEPLSISSISENKIEEIPVENEIEEPPIENEIEKSPIDSALEEPSIESEMIEPPIEMEEPPIENEVGEPPIENEIEVPPDMDMEDVQVANHESRNEDTPLAVLSDDNDLNNDIAESNIFSQKMQELVIDDEDPPIERPSANKISTSKAAEPKSAVWRPRNLRSRKPIQVSPFTLEKMQFEQYRSQLGKRAKHKEFEPTYDSDSDTEFTPTQALEETAEEIMPLSRNKGITAAARSKPPTNQQPTAKASRNVATTSKRNPQLIKPTNIPPSSSTSLGKIENVTSLLSSSKGKRKAITNQQLSITTAPSRSLTTTSASILNNSTNIPRSISKPQSSTSTKDPYEYQYVENVDRKGKKTMATFNKKKKNKKHQKTNQRIMQSANAPITQTIFDLNKLNTTVSDTAEPATNTKSRLDFSVLEEGLSQFVVDDVPITILSDNEYAIFSGNENDEMEEDDDDEEEEVVAPRKPRKRRRSIDDESESEEPVETVEYDDSIFDFPPPSQDDSIFGLPPPKRHLGLVAVEDNNVNEEHIVPIVDDGYEYHEKKRRLVAIEDIKRDKTVTHGVLPHSYNIVFAKKLAEEQKSRRSIKKKSTAQLKPATIKHTTRTARDDEDIFAPFRESESEDSDDDDNGFDMDDYFAAKATGAHPNNHNTSSRSVAREESSESSRTRTETRPTLAPIFKQTKLKLPRTQSGASISRPIPNDTAYPEALEDNRLSKGTASTASTNNRRTTNNQTKASSSTSKSRRSAPKKSSVAIAPPANNKFQVSSLIRIMNNPTPRKKIKQPKRTTDDIYVHNPYFTGICRKARRFDSSTSKRSTTKIRALDDIYLGTKLQAKYYNVYVGYYDKDAIMLEASKWRPKEVVKPKHTIYTLESVARRIRQLHDYDLRRFNNLKNTVYLHHRLLSPLLTTTPNKSSVYATFKDRYADLVLFGRPFHWKYIEPKHESDIHYFFGKLFQDISHLCSQHKQDIDKDQDQDHDHFCVFVSICLTQWIPTRHYVDQLRLTEIFTNHIRGLALMISKLVEDKKINLPWKSLIKVMLFILDWTCRLHHLGVSYKVWSIKEHVQLLMDMLVYIGFDEVQKEDKEYLIEAWIFIIQILSVSSDRSGYLYGTKIFLEQINKSIKTKSKTIVEWEKRKTTRLWAEILDLIIEKYV